MIDRERLLGLEGDSYGLALAILEYLARHPNAADTAEGIARFWLKGDSMAEAVEEVMVELADRRLVRQTRQPDGGRIYSRLRDHGALEGDAGS